MTPNQFTALVPWILKILLAGDITTKPTESYGTIFHLQYNHTTDLNERTFTVTAANWDTRQNITARFPVLPAEYRASSYVLMEFIIQLGNSLEPLTFLKATSNMLDREKLFVNILGHGTRKSLHEMGHPQWWNSVSQYVQT
jgi:hypothetical protein